MPSPGPYGPCSHVQSVIRARLQREKGRGMTPPCADCMLGVVHTWPLLSSLYPARWGWGWGGRNYYCLRFTNVDTKGGQVTFPSSWSLSWDLNTVSLQSPYPTLATQSVVRRLDASWASPGSLLDLQNLELQLRPTELSPHF